MSLTPQYNPITILTNDHSYMSSFDKYDINNMSSRAQIKANLSWTPPLPCILYIHLRSDSILQVQSVTSSSSSSSSHYYLCRLLQCNNFAPASVLHPNHIWSTTNRQSRAELMPILRHTRVRTRPNSNPIQYTSFVCVCVMWCDLGFAR